MSSFFTERGALPTLLTLAMFGLGACTEVQVEETKVELDTTSCSSGAGGGGGNNNNRNGQNGGGNQSQPNMSAVMDTYIVQIFELNDPGNLSAPNAQDCGACIASRSNCFFEKETCVCGDPTSVSADKLPGMLQDVRLSIPANYGSIYCMRIMAVQRTSQPEQCQCDSSWETPDRVRLCAVSEAYAAGPLPVQMPVLCAPSSSFDACATDTTSSTSMTATTTTSMN